MAFEMRLLQKCAPLLEPLREHLPRKYDDVIIGIENAVAPHKKHFPHVVRWVEGMKFRN